MYSWCSSMYGLFGVSLPRLQKKKNTNFTGNNRLLDKSCLRSPLYLRWSEANSNSLHDFFA